VRAVIHVRNALGWNPTTIENLPTRLMCVVSELDEFEDALAVPESGRCYDRGHASEELADVAMYLICALDDLWRDRWGARALHPFPSPHQAPGQLTKPVRHEVVRAMQSWRLVESPWRLADTCICLELALRNVMRIAVSLGFGLEAAIYAKVRVLERRLLDRGPRSGGKHPDS
jgi:hypothetical protein